MEWFILATLILYYGSCVAVVLERMHEPPDPMIAYRRTQLAYTQVLIDKQKGVPAVNWLKEGF